MSRGLAIVALIGAAALAVAGCDDKATPVTAEVDDRPGVATPTGVVRRFEWHWNRRDTTRYGELFSADFEFVFDVSDTAGNAYLRRALTRDLEIAAGRAVLVTGLPTEPPPVAVSLTFDPNLAALPDPRPGRSAIAHRLIAVGMLLRIEQPDIEVRGGNRIYVVRGDSAAWPAGVPHVGPDSARWFIQRWEDLTLGDETLALLPSQNKTLGQVKALYLPRPPLP
jgi:hypothetical protein